MVGRKSFLCGLRRKNNRMYETEPDLIYRVHEWKKSE